MKASKCTGVVVLEGANGMNLAVFSSRQNWLWKSGALLCLSGLLGCQADVKSNENIGDLRDRILTRQSDEAEQRERTRGGPQSQPVIEPVAGQAKLGNRQALMTAPAITTQPAPTELLEELPDPVDAPQVFDRRIRAVHDASRAERLGAETDRVTITYQNVVQRAMEYLELMRRPKQVRLSLAEAVQRTLEHSYIIRAESYNPAIARMDLVRAESVFDLVYTLGWDQGWSDPPAPEKVINNFTDQRTLNTGVQQLLPTGMTAQIGYNYVRRWTDFGQKVPANVLNGFNPSYTNSLGVSLTQPLLKGFGLDYNRATIELARDQQKISREQFEQNVRETILGVEKAYWTLVRVRRTVLILAESVGQNAVTYQSIVERLKYDATPVEQANSQSEWRSSEVSFQEAVKAVRDAEDVLKNLMNDPDFRLSDDVEIVPTDDPLVAPVMLDQFAEVRTALEERSEIRAARLLIDQTRIGTMKAKNETLPQLDAKFSYEIQGLGPNWEDSYYNMTKDFFQSYSYGITLTYPIGNRGPEAALTKARLQESQALVNLRRVMDDAVLDVNNAVRDLRVRYEQVPSAFDAVVAAVRNLRSLQARTEKINPAFLDTELRGVQNIAQTRSQLLQIITDYNIALVQLERSKGTLLRYNNIVLSDAAGSHK